MVTPNAAVCPYTLRPRVPVLTPFPLTFFTTELKYPYSARLIALDLMSIWKVYEGFAPVIVWRSHLLRERGILDTDVRSFMSSGSLRNVPRYAVCVHTTHTAQAVREYLWQRKLRFKCCFLNITNITNDES